MLNCSDTAVPMCCTDGRRAYYHAMTALNVTARNLTACISPKVYWCCTADHGSPVGRCSCPWRQECVTAHHLQTSLLLIVAPGVPAGRLAACQVHIIVALHGLPGARDICESSSVEVECNSSQAHTRASICRYASCTHEKTPSALTTGTCSTHRRVHAAHACMQPIPREGQAKNHHRCPLAA